MFGQEQTFASVGSEWRRPDCAAPRPGALAAVLPNALWLRQRLTSLFLAGHLEVLSRQQRCYGTAFFRQQVLRWEVATARPFHQPVDAIHSTSASRLRVAPAAAGSVTMIDTA